MRGRQAFNAVGLKYGLLTVVSQSGQYWTCQCDCGGSKTVAGANIKNGGTRSCGCIRGRQNITHGFTRGGKHASVYCRWASMVNRCTKPTVSTYKYYGGRGITVHPDFMTFEGFYKHLGDPPPGTTLDRIDNDKGYEPGNVRWVSMKTNCQNRGGKRKANMVKIGGITKPLTEWCRDHGVLMQMVYHRIKNLGWDPLMALTTPPMRCSIPLKKRA